MNNSIRYSSLENLEEYVLNLGEKKFRAKQLYDWVFKRGITSYDDISNLPKSLINSLRNDFALPNIKIKDIQIDDEDERRKSNLMQVSINKNLEFGKIIDIIKRNY